MAGTGPSTCSKPAAPRSTWAHPLGVKGFAYRRVKNDARDASDLADGPVTHEPAARGVDRSTRRPRTPRTRPVQSLIPMSA